MLRRIASVTPDRRPVDLETVGRGLRESASGSSPKSSWSVMVANHPSWSRQAESGGRSTFITSASLSTARRMPMRAAPAVGLPRATAMSS